MAGLTTKTTDQYFTIISKAKQELDDGKFVTRGDLLAFITNEILQHEGMPTDDTQNDTSSA